jgi:hypothetical protein
MTYENKKRFQRSERENYDEEELQFSAFRFMDHKENFNFRSRAAERPVHMTFDGKETSTNLQHYNEPLYEKPLNEHKVRMKQHLGDDDSDDTPYRWAKGKSTK